jgi:hypothetical protein
MISFPEGFVKEGPFLAGIPQIDSSGGMGKVGGRRESGNGGKWSKERG